MCAHHGVCTKVREQLCGVSFFLLLSVFQELNSDCQSCMVSPFAHWAILPGHFLSPNDNFRYENVEWDRVVLTVITVFRELMWENCKFVADLRYVSSSGWQALYNKILPQKCFSNLPGTRKYYNDSSLGNGLLFWVSFHTGNSVDSHDGPYSFTLCNS